MIRAVKSEDARQILNIYNYYVENTVITFEEDPVDLQEMEKRIEKITSTHPWFVLEVDGKIQAYAYGSPWRVKSAYRFSSELTVYVHKNSRGKGYGTKLYKHLMDTLTESGMHCLYGVIALPNEGSSALHDKLGFTKCGHFSQVGYKFEKWLDVGYWEKVISV